MKIIATSDWHLHQMRPRMRTDEDWLGTQRVCLNSLARLAIEHHMPVFIAGDIFDTPTVSSAILNMALAFVIHLQNEVGVTYISGNHDQPYHSYERINESSYGILKQVHKDVRGLIVGRSDFCGPNDSDGVTVLAHDIFRDQECDIVMAHTFAVRDEKDKPPMRDSVCAEELLAMYPNARIILVGDNHTPWSYRKGGRLVVNCGSLMRRTMDDLGHPTGFWVVDTQTLEAEHVSPFDSIELSCIDTSYADSMKAIKESKAQYDELIDALRNGMDSRYDFMESLEKYVYGNEKVLGEDVSSLLREMIVDIKNSRRK